MEDFINNHTSQKLGNSTTNTRDLPFFQHVQIVKRNKEKFKENWQEIEEMSFYLKKGYFRNVL